MMTRISSVTALALALALAAAATACAPKYINVALSVASTRAVGGRGRRRSEVVEEPPRRWKGVRRFRKLARGRARRITSARGAFLGQEA